MSKQSQSLLWYSILVFAVIAVGLTVFANQPGSAPDPVVEGSETQPPQRIAVQDCKSGKCASFVALGDSGSGVSFQHKVAHQLAEAYKRKPYTHVLMLGDILYPDGNIKHIKDRFEVPYQFLREADVNFVVSLGNHDMLKGWRDQMTYFKMPGKYYTVPTEWVTFFVIDSNTFYKDADQQAWLGTALENATTPWKVVIGHHPPFTSGAHQGERDLKALKNTLVPVLTNNGAHLYLAGHDHDYERFAKMAGVTYFVSGGGGAYLRDFKKSVLPTSVRRVKRHHFLRFDVDGDHLYFKAIDSAGRIFDAGRLSLDPDDEPKPKRLLVPMPSN